VEAADPSAALVINDEQGAAARGLQGCAVQALGLRQTGWGFATTPDPLLRRTLPSLLQRANAQVTS
jgi:hypothetical protein